MNSRITEILENLAILSQALHSDQENVNTIDILGEIKLLSAQLYLESDMEIITSNKPQEVPVIEEEVIGNDSTEPLFDEVPVFTFVKNEPEIEEIEVEESPSIENNNQEDLQISQEIELEIIPESGPHVHITQTTFELENVPTLFDELESELSLEEAEDIANEVIAEEVVVNSILESKMENEIIMPPSVQENMKKAEAAANANAIIGQFSLTRRYEFMNFLFAGDMNKFTVFISEMLTAPAGELREKIYEKWYDENQWSRKYETAADLKKNLSKLL
jgi:hypothetical protein